VIQSLTWRSSPLCERFLFSATLALLFALSLDVQAQESPQTPDAQEPAPAAAEADKSPELEVEADDDDAAPPAKERDEVAPFRWRSRSENVIVHIGEDSHLPKNERADAVVSIFGSASSDGEVDEVVVSVFGDTHAAGPVGQSVVAVFGSTYANEYVGDQVVAVFGDVTLGPKAEVNQDVVAVGGKVIRDPGAVVHGGVREVFFGEGVGRLEWVRPWIEHCLLYGRPLAIEPGLGWAWGVALAFLALYVLLAMLFGDAVNKCVETLDRKPGESLLAALLSILLTPVAFMLLLITLIGVALMPFVALALFVAAVFGKAVVLAWIGRKVTRFTGVGPFAHAAFPVLVGGVIMLGVYLVPVLGYIAYQLTGILGLGVVLYTTLLAIQARRAHAAPAFAAATAPAVAAATTAGVTIDNPPSAAFAKSPRPAAPAAAAVGDSASLPRAGFWIRMAALLLDGILVGVIVSILEAPGEIWLLGLAGYGALMWKLKSTTIGGIVCDLQVVRIDGREIDWDTAIVRALSCFLSFAAAGLGFLWIAFDAERQAWHDKIAGTVVVRTARAGAAQNARG
jgi:uncharacterized RDD family membrane protein YckC